MCCVFIQKSEQGEQRIIRLPTNPNGGFNVTDLHAGGPKSCGPGQNISVLTLLS